MECSKSLGLRVEFIRKPNINGYSLRIEIVCATRPPNQTQLSSFAENIITMLYEEKENKAKERRSVKKEEVVYSHKHCAFPNALLSLNGIINRQVILSSSKFTQGISNCL